MFHYSLKPVLNVTDWATFSVFPEYNISAAAIAIFSLAFMILGSLCLMGSCTGASKKRDYLLKPAGMFFAFAGGFSYYKMQFPLQLVKFYSHLAFMITKRFISREHGNIICYCKLWLMLKHRSPSQVSARSSHWRWCVSQWSAWSRARRQFGSSTTTAGPLLVRAPALCSSSSVALHSWSSPCPRCPGIHGKLAWTPSRNKSSDSEACGQMREKKDCLILNTHVRFNDDRLTSE